MTSVAFACTCEVEGTKECTACQAYESFKRGERLNFRIDRSGIPRSLRGKSFLAAPPGAAADASRRWADGETLGLALTGAVGSGKTWLAAAAAWARLQDHPLTWVSVSRMMSQLRSGFGSDEKKAADAIVTGTGSIVLDDLDKVNPTDFGKEILFTAIDARVAEGSSILVTANRPLSTIGDIY